MQFLIAYKNFNKGLFLKRKEASHKKYLIIINEKNKKINQKNRVIKRLVDYFVVYFCFIFK